MNQKAKDYIRRNTLDLESDNRMDSTGYVQYAISEAKAYAAIAIAEEGMRQKAIEAFKFAVDGYFMTISFLKSYWMKEKRSYVLQTFR